MNDFTSIRPIAVENAVVFFKESKTQNSLATFATDARKKKKRKMGERKIKYSKEDLHAM